MMCNDVNSLIKDDVDAKKEKRICFTRYSGRRISPKKVVSLFP